MITHENKDGRHHRTGKQIDQLKSTLNSWRAMTYNRLEAVPIPGQRCRFCGDEKAPLVKTRCCDQWICCDTDFVSFRGGGRCQYQHERFSLCHSHFAEGHEGPWKTCQVCRTFWTPAQYKEYAENPINTPKY
jgi:hypothetical protein